MLLSQSLELCHIGGNSLLTLCRVENVNDLIVGGNLSHTFCTSFWTYGPHAAVRARIYLHTQA